MQATIERHPGITLVRLAGDLRLHGRSSAHYELAELRQSALSETPGVVVLSLQALAYADSLGIAELAMFPIDCGKRQIQLRLIMPGGMLREALRRLKIFETWPAFEDEASALAPAKPA